MKRSHFHRQIVSHVRSLPPLHLDRYLEYTRQTTALQQAFQLHQQLLVRTRACADCVSQFASQTATLRHSQSIDRSFDEVLEILNQEHEAVRQLPVPTAFSEESMLQEFTFALRTVPSPSDVFEKLLAVRRVIPQEVLDSWLPPILEQRILWRMLQEDFLRRHGDESDLLIDEHDSHLHSTEADDSTTMNSAASSSALVLPVIEEYPDVTSIVEDSATFVQERCKDELGAAPHIHIDSDIPNGVKGALVWEQLQYVLTELLKNACVASVDCNQTSRSKGHAGLAGDASLQHRVPSISIRCSLEINNRFVIEIQDRAGGIPLTAQSSVWSFGWTGHDKRRLLAGCGVGLPLARVYASVFGGSLTMQSEEGVGTLFRFEHPWIGVERSV